MKPPGLPHRVRRRVARAFTLLEVLLAVVLVVGLLGAALAFYRYAADARRSVIDAAEGASAHRAAMDRITADLRSLAARGSLTPPLEGQADSLRLTHATLPGPGAWPAKEAGENPPPPESDTELVGYRLRAYANERGDWQIDGIERTLQRNPALRAAEEGTDILGMLMTPRFKFLRFRYWDGGAWVETWAPGSGGGDLPSGVEVALGIEPLPEGVAPADYPFPTFRRTVYLPASAPAAGGGVVGGIGGGGR